MSPRKLLKSRYVLLPVTTCITLYAAPGATIQLERLQKQLMLAIRPALTLLCDSIWLSRL